MANPQKENGYTAIANEIVEALWRVNLSPYESRVLWYLFRKTYGWAQKTDWIALSQFSKNIGLDRRLIHRAIHSLSSKKMIVIYRDDRNNISYGFQKDYEKWKVSSKKMTIICRDDEVSSVEMTRVSSVEIHTKETITKETITKEKGYSLTSDEIRLSEFLHSLILSRNPKFKNPNIQSWASHIDKMIRIDKRTPADIKEIIAWCQQDSFWQNNILSTQTLRKQFDKLFMKANQSKGSTLHQKILSAGERWLRQTE